MPHYERYVAIGDSTSEGLDDPDGRGGYRGWANRLAEHIAARQGSVLYANLAIRGRTTRQIQRLGTVGNSGNTSEPHLHIHAERAGVGVPARFDGRWLVRNAIVRR